MKLRPLVLLSLLILSLLLPLPAQAKNGGGGGTFHCAWISGCVPGPFVCCIVDPVDEAMGTCTGNYDYDPGKCIHIGNENECSHASFPCVEIEPTPVHTRPPRTATPTPTTPPDSPPPSCVPIDTAIGEISICDINTFIVFLLTWSLGIAGGLFLLVTLYASFLIMTSTNAPRQLRAGQELLVSALAGIIMLIFSVFLLRFIGVDLLKIPGF